MIPIFPNFLAITLSSKEFNPKVLDCLTSLRHFAHLCMAYFVRPTKNGIIRIVNSDNIGKRVLNHKNKL